MIRIIFWSVMAYLVYQYLQNKKSGDVLNEGLLLDPEGETNQFLLTQPQQKFPLTRQIDPRVDNADQPWYVDSRRFMGKADIKVFDNSEDRDANVMSYNTGDFWMELNAKYGIH